MASTVVASLPVALVSVGMERLMPVAGTLLSFLIAE